MMLAIKGTQAGFPTFYVDNHACLSTFTVSNPAYLSTFLEALPTVPGGLMVYNICIKYVPA